MRALPIVFVTLVRVSVSPLASVSFSNTFNKVAGLSSNNVYSSSLASAGELDPVLLNTTCAVDVNPCSFETE